MVRGVVAFSIEKRRSSTIRAGHRIRISMRFARNIIAHVLLSPLAGQRLPIRSYTTAEGLADNHVKRIRSDSRGFLWLCTDEGLSRFDGHSFTNYTVRD